MSYINGELPTDFSCFDASKCQDLAEIVNAGIEHFCPAGRLPRIAWLNVLSAPGENGLKVRVLVALEEGSSKSLLRLYGSMDYLALKLRDIRLKNGKGWIYDKIQQVSSIDSAINSSKFDLERMGDGARQLAAYTDSLFLTLTGQRMSVRQAEAIQITPFLGVNQINEGSVVSDAHSTNQALYGMGW